MTAAEAEAETTLPPPPPADEGNKDENEDNKTPRAALLFGAAAVCASAREAQLEELARRAWGARAGARPAAFCVRDGVGYWIGF